MAKSLKQKNQPQLITFVVSNAIGLGLLALGPSRLLAVLQELSKGDWTILAIPAFLTLVTGTLGWVVPRAGKEFLVFWKIRNCLPSSGAFTLIGPHDPRVDMQRLIGKYRSLPQEPGQQTQLWYRIYRAHKEEASVEDAHGAFLRFREMTTLCVAFLVVSTVSVAYFAIGGRKLLLGVLILVMEYLIVMIAARNAATRFVANVLALESATYTGDSANQESA